MATASSFTQDSSECDNCEENRAQFLCKMCPGHLCMSSKSEHKRRNITHEVIRLTPVKGNIMELLHCSKHTTTKLERYCSLCQTPVCTLCLMETHNGHEVENLTLAYNRIKNKLLKEKEEIETTLLPKYEELLAKGNEIEAHISMTDEVQKQIEDHTESLNNRLTAIKTKRVQDLRQKEKKALGSVANWKTEIECRIKALKVIKTKISNNVGATPGITFFKATNSNILNKMREYSKPIRYKVDDFSLGDIEKMTWDIDFVELP